MRHCAGGCSGRGKHRRLYHSPDWDSRRERAPAAFICVSPAHDHSRLLFLYDLHEDSRQLPPAMATTYDGEPEMTLQHESNRPTSIDLSLALERELDNESLPNSPNPPRPQSLDTHVLASIVTQLRLSLAEVTKERDTLKEHLAEAQTREGGLKEALEHVTDKCLHCENELEAAAAKRQEDEETISMLRTKVEESRYVTSAAMSATLC